MDPTRFDRLARSLARSASRRRALGSLLGAALVPLGGTAATDARSRHRHGTRDQDGNSACAAFCAAVFPPGRDRGQCVRDAAHGAGLCVACDGDPARLCNGACCAAGETCDGTGQCQGVGQPLDCPDATIQCWFQSQTTGACDVQIGTLPGTVGTCYHFPNCCPCAHRDHAYWSNLCNQTFSECRGRCVALDSLPFLIPGCFCCPPGLGIFCT
jgi:hypothetical protein